MLGRCLLAALLGWFALIAEAAPATSVYGVTNGNDSAAATNQSPGGSASSGFNRNTSSAADNLDPIDWNRAQILYRQFREGRQLSSADQAYLDRAKAAHAKANQSPSRSGATSDPGVPSARVSTGLTPLDQMTARDNYKGQDGGLYGGGENQPPALHLQWALAESEKIIPLDAAGQPSAQGKIGLLSVGMSNTTMEYARFKQLADADPAKSANVIVLDGAQGGQTAMRWADPKSALWPKVDERMQAAGLSAKQIQVAWMKPAEARPAQYGEFPRHAKQLQENLVKSLANLKEKLPNLRLVYLSSRIYAGYATTALNPEPYAYEEAFAMRWLIQDQMAGKPELNWDPARGAVKAPLLLWGPYLWADGMNPRQTDGLTYARQDLSPVDGTHPTDSARAKVATLLLNFLKTDPTAKVWFTSKASAKPADTPSAPEAKWHPGHYAFIQFKALDERDFYEGFRGIQKGYTWRSLEPEPDHYDFSEIRADLALLGRHGRRLVIQVQTKTFGAGQNYCPDYLSGPAYGGGVYRTRWGSFNPLIWNEPVNRRLNALYTRLGRALDREPFLEAVVIPESATTFDPGDREQLHYTTDAYARAVESGMQALKDAFPATVVIQYVNMPPEVTPALADYAKTHGVGFGGPDVYPHDPVLTDPQRGVYRLYAPLSGIVPLGAAVQPNDYTQKTAFRGAGGETPVQEIYEFGRDQLRLNYIFWSPRSGYFEKVQAMMAAPSFPKDPAGGLSPVLPKSLGVTGSR